MVAMAVIRRVRPDGPAAAARNRATRLELLAETMVERAAPSCRDVRGEQNRLRETAGRADQRARLLEEATGWRPRRGR
jgi:hypothetical protein